ncbi:MAG: peptide synthetase, partial [Gammaproteobacteria bacterium]|nr:peptide synthetase [Gammaproteobacteria bacterium]
MEKMDICKTISCYLIGEDKLVIQCGERLLAKNHRILGIISSIPAIQSWATQHSIPYFTSLVEFKTLNLEKPCDYLFSLVNYQILPPWALALPNYCAINYHDSLLPQYAGIHSTSWALINQEKTHGITWHVINEGLDAGDILKQAMTPINQDETALSLNLKCYNLAISTFSALIDELATHAYQRTAQNLAQRSYFGRYTKPPVNGWIDWRQPAERIDNLCRALQFGSTINRLATPKFAVGNEVFVIDKQALSERLSTAEPGTIVAINSQAIRIATQTFDLDISRCRTLDNGAYTPLELDHQYQLKIGDKLKEMSPQEQLFLEQYGQEQSVHEAFWVHELERLNPINIPFLNPHLTKELSPDYTLFA